jgi:hypothetical protein
LCLRLVRRLAQTVATGLFAGITVGAFNIGGPWIAIYGQCRRWKAERFASNMVTYQAPTCVFTLAIHVLRGAFADRTLWWYIALALPGMLLGARLGDFAAARISEGGFKRLTLGLIAVMGLRLLLASLSAPAAAATAALLACAALGIALRRSARAAAKGGAEMGASAVSLGDKERVCPTKPPSTNWTRPAHLSYDELPLDELPTAHGAVASGFGMAHGDGVLTRRAERPGLSHAGNGLEKGQG